MSSPAQPPAYDAVGAAQKQGEMNKQTAVTQFGLNATNQVTPQGNLSYRQIGTWDDGTPRFEATQSLSPGEQSIYDTESRNRLNLGRVGGAQIDRVGELLSRPVSLDNAATEGRLMELGRKRLDPMLAERRAGMESKLANQGIAPGSEAWTTQMRQLGETENDAFNQLMLSGRGQSVQELLTERNQPLNEITALMSGSQVSQPNFTTTPQTSVAPVDYMGATQFGANQQMDIYKQKVGSNNALMGGLFGLAAAPLGGFAQGYARRA